ncbi:MAG: hypothetical protein K5840_03085 [Eubacterium sp.]|nr:hypothetical protein [Eubacterium sp.]
MKNTLYVKKAAAGAIAALMLAVVIVSAFFVAAEAGHHCDDDDCPICSCIQICESVLHQMGDGSVGVSVVTAIAAFELLTVAMPGWAEESKTLVTAKVRMND